MARKKASPTEISRDDLVDLLNGDLAREYQAIIAYVVYSQRLKGPEYMAIAEELKDHAKEELEHALVIARQIDYLGGRPTTIPAAVSTSEEAREMLRIDLDNENDTVAHYQERVEQCEALGEYAMAEHIREILKTEQEHRIELAAALNEEVPDMTRAPRSVR